MREVVDNWVESRLWNDLTAEDREFLLDIGMLDRLDAELVDEVLEGGDLMRRLDDLADAVGPFEPVPGSAGRTLRLHPMIRAHCVARRRRETPERFRAIYRRLAVVMARRGDTVAAIRHAAEAGDAGLAGQIFEDAGGLRLWLREGAGRFLAADRFVTGEVVAPSRTAGAGPWCCAVAAGAGRGSTASPRRGCRDAGAGRVGSGWGR